VVGVWISGGAVSMMTAFPLLFSYRVDFDYSFGWMAIYIACSRYMLSVVVGVGYRYGYQSLKFSVLVAMVGGHWPKMISNEIGL
jgi:hypothetical protein